MVRQKWQKAVEGFRSFVLTPFGFLVPLLAAAIAPIPDTKGQFACLFIIAIWITLLLLFHNDIVTTLFPFLCLMVAGMPIIYDIDKLLGNYIPYVAIPVAALIFHAIYYRRPQRIGITFYGIVATSLAILLGGLGTISAAEYFNLTTLYHTVGSVLCLLFVYLLCAPDYKEKKSYDLVGYFMQALFFVGVLSVLTILELVIEHGMVDGSLQFHRYMAVFPYRNALANLMIMVFPAPFYFICKTQSPAAKLFFFFMGGIFYIGLLFTTARTALLFGSVLLLILIGYFFYYEKNRLIKLIFGVLLCFCAALFLWFAVPLGLFNVRLGDGEGLVKDNEARVQLLYVSIDDFFMNPFFGIGIGNTRHADLYSAPGMVSYYHLYFPQIWGSMGLFGLLAYGYQFMLRLRCSFTKPNFSTMALTLCYLGGFFYSMTDPGEFTTIPYGILAVLLYILLEKHTEEVTEPLPLRALSRRGRVLRLLLGE